MEKEVNCINFKGLFTYVERYYGKASLEKLVNTALAKDDFLIENKSDPSLIEKITVMHLMDDAYWISYKLSVAILTSIKEVVPGPRPEYKAGKRMILDSLSHRELLVSRFMGTRSLLKRASKINRRFNRSKEVKVTSLKKNTATIELRYNPKHEVVKEVCEWNIGIYEGIGIISGSKNIKIYESKCITENGKLCELKVVWQNPSFLNRLSRSFLRFFTKNLFEEYERILSDREILINKLEDSEKRYRQLVENQTDLVVKFDLKGRFSFVNSSFIKMFGESRKDFEGKSLFSYLYREDRKTTAEEVKIIFKPPHTGTIVKRAITKDGIRWFSWVATAVLDENGTVIAINAVGRDITENKKMEEALKKAESLFKLITDNTKALVAIHDAGANYVYVSPSHESMGYTADDLMGKTSFSMMDERDKERMLGYLIDGQAGKRSSLVADYRLVSKDGRVVDFRGAFDAVYDKDGRLDRIVSVADDITELKKEQTLKEQAQHQAAEAKKLALVGQVAGKMAHDFNNILSIIMGVGELTLIDCNDEKTRENISLILTQTQRGKNLTRNLVAFAKSSEPKQNFFRINDKVNMVLTLLKKDLDKISVNTDFAPDIPELLADPGMIEHTLVNIFQNSIHALSKTDEPAISIRTKVRDKKILITIEDNGCGIPDVYLNSIYEPSFTLKGSKDTRNSYRDEIRGTGYGMANVKKYVEQHKGSIEVESTEGEGTKFYIRLPLTKRELSNDEIIRIEDQRGNFNKYGLVVEDEPDIANVQESVLSGAPCNHRIDIAQNGKTALALIEKNKYDFITLDYILPGDISGMDIYRKIRESNQIVPILFISGNIEFLESIKDLTGNDHAVDHISKPCTNLEFISSINSLLNRAG